MSFLFFLKKNVGQNGGKPRLDLNVEAAWAQGYTGRNITTAIMDDGQLFFLFKLIYTIDHQQLFFELNFAFAINCI